PTGNLDQNSGRAIIDLLEQLNAAGMTLLIVTHDSDIGSRAGRHIRMVDGRIIEDTALAA
ncbi:MAG: macrolide ABC transporter ATP-binding protein, partial [Gammaproteobacteria bacterium]|nr:macrolide ABC transporter ATP-binding protein [Gammaproteobacteria bacterium]